MEQATIDKGGRPATTSASKLATAARELFISQGFERTSVEDIAAAVGVSRRTFFRYFPTKADVLWLESDAEIDRLNAYLAADEGIYPPRQVLESAIVAALMFRPADERWARYRAQLVLTVPSVHTQAARMYHRIHESVIAFLARRGIWLADEMAALTFAHATTAAIMAAHEYWITHPETTLPDCLQSTIRLLVPEDPGTEGMAPHLPATAASIGMSRGPAIRSGW